MGYTDTLDKSTSPNPSVNSSRVSEPLPSPSRESKTTSSWSGETGSSALRRCMSLLVMKPFSSMSHRRNSSWELGTEQSHSGGTVPGNWEQSKVIQAEQFLGTGNKAKSHRRNSSWELGTKQSHSGGTVPGNWEQSKVTQAEQFLGIGNKE